MPHCSPSRVTRASAVVASGQRHGLPGAVTIRPSFNPPPYARAMPSRIIAVSSGHAHNRHEEKWPGPLGHVRSTEQENTSEGRRNRTRRGISRNFRPGQICTRWSGRHTAGREIWPLNPVRSAVERPSRPVRKGAGGSLSRGWPSHERTSSREALHRHATSPTAGDGS
jgi:hypothetical protein